MAHATDLQRIADLEDPVLRTLQITQAYHKLAHGLRTKPST